ncbi:hypothetical protein HYZ99_01195 [Candidatus Peregrinibacteria bacterium]|nr:hypothetical protein [Candidatus Peregrinibacteria bacterium]
MSASVTTKELRNSQVTDLERDVRAQQSLVAKLRMGIKLQKEKDSAKYKREKKTLARMMTVLTEKRETTTKSTKTTKKESSLSSSSSLSSPPKKSKISAPRS